jgi:hypothetical protein
VVEEPVDRAGDALGHAWETSEVFSAWPRRQWLSAAIIVPNEPPAHPPLE